MAVGITILSGTRSGEEFAFDQAEFRAGDDPTCEVFFDRQREPAVAGSETLFRLGDDGWYVKKVRGAGLMVNNHPIETSTRLRSGDVVQLASDGPKFTFKLLARMPAAASVGRPARPSEAKDDLAGSTTVEPSAGNLPHHSPKTIAWHLPTAVAVGFVIGLVALSVVARRPGHYDTTDTVSNTALPDANQTASAAPAEQSVDTGEATKPPQAIDKGVEDAEIQEVGDTAPPVARAPKDSPDDAVLLLLVEEPKSASAWPFGSAAVIADRTLLTSATVATGLAGFRDKGWRLWAANQRLGLKIEITDLRVHTAFAGAQGDPEKQIYVDIGLLTVGDALPKHLDMATADEFAELDRGMPVTLFGYLYENEPVDRFQTFLPEPHLGKLFVMTSLPPSPSGPRLMHVRAELAGKLYGAPVLNQAGHIVGIFAETALPLPDQQDADLQIHYAPVADREQIGRWINDHDEQWWAVPQGPKSEVQSRKL